MSYDRTNSNNLRKEEKMFDNVGGKLKSIAVLSMLVGIAVSIAAGAAFLGNEDTVIIGLVIIAAGIVVSWISSLGVYGFGTLIENSDIVVSKLENLSKRAVNKPAVDTIEEIKAEKERIASLLKSGKMKQAEYDKALVKLWAEEEKLKKAIVNKSKTFDQILVESGLSSEQKTKLLEIKALKDDGFITQNDCKNRMTAVLQDVPLDLLVSLLEKV
jgi:hypothetical protein